MGSTVSKDPDAIAQVPETSVPGPSSAAGDTCSVPTAESQSSTFESHEPRGHSPVESPFNASKQAWSYSGAGQNEHSHTSNNGKPSDDVPCWEDPIVGFTPLESAFSARETDTGTGHASPAKGTVNLSASLHRRDSSRSNESVGEITLL